MKKLIYLPLIILLSLTACPLFQKQVKYKVTCTATPNLVDITIENEDGGTSQFADVATPWAYEFESTKDAFVYVSAQNQQNNGSVTVTIYINGDVFKTSTSTGAYVIATASGSIP